MGDAADDAYDAAMWEDDEPEIECPFCTFCGDPCECGWADAEQVIKGSDNEGGEVYTAAHLQALLGERDAFIVSKGLWSDFCATLPYASPQSQPVMSEANEPSPSDPPPGREAVADLVYRLRAEDWKVEGDDGSYDLRQTPHEAADMIERLSAPLTVSREAVEAAVNKWRREKASFGVAHRFLVRDTSSLIDAILALTGETSRG